MAGILNNAPIETKTTQVRKIVPTVLAITAIALKRQKTTNNNEIIAKAINEEISVVDKAILTSLPKTNKFSLVALTVL